jgi:hypothetical protein
LGYRTGTKEMAISSTGYQNGGRMPNETVPSPDGDVMEGVTMPASVESIDLDRHDMSYSVSPEPGRRDDEASYPTSPLAGNSPDLGRRDDEASSPSSPFATTTPLVNGVHTDDHMSDDGQMYDATSGNASEFFFSAQN